MCSLRIRGRLDKLRSEPPQRSPVRVVRCHEQRQMLLPVFLENRISGESAVEPGSPAPGVVDLVDADQLHVDGVAQAVQPDRLDPSESFPNPAESRSESAGVVRVLTNRVLTIRRMAGATSRTRPAGHGSRVQNASRVVRSKASSG